LSAFSFGLSSQVGNFKPLNELYEKYVEGSQDNLKEKHEQLLTSYQQLKKAHEETLDRIKEQELAVDDLNQKVIAEKENTIRKLVEIKTELTESVEKEITDFNEVANDRKNKIIQLGEHLDDLGEGAAASLAGRKFQEHADKERSLAYLAYSIGIGSLLAGIVIIIIVGQNIIGIDIDSISWKSIFFKTAITLLISVVATVSIRIGSHAMYRSNEFKRQHLEVTSLFALLGRDSALQKDVAENPATKAKVNFLTNSYGKTWDANHKLNSDETALGSDVIAKMLYTALQGMLEKK